MNTQHTPTPWILGKAYGNRGVEVVGDGGNRMVCGVIGVDRNVRDKDGRVTGVESDPEGTANAAFIVRACNAHDALVAALSDLEDIFDGQEDCDDGVPNDAMRAMTIIRAALAKAGSA